MNEKFTPGPWKRAINLSRNGSGKPRGMSPSRIVDENNCVIAFTCPRLLKGDQIANTNLIAIAPKMYKELQKCVELLKTLHVDIAVNEIEMLLSEGRGE